MNLTEEQIREAAEQHVLLQYPMGVEKEPVIDDFSAGVTFAMSQDQSVSVDAIKKLIDLQKRSAARYKACFEKENPNGHQVFEYFAIQLSRLLPNP